MKNLKNAALLKITNLQMFFWSTQSNEGIFPMEQCVTFGSSEGAVKVFTVFFLISVYFIPLIIMVFTYSHILVIIIRKTSNNGKPSFFATSLVWKWFLFQHWLMLLIQDLNGVILAVLSLKLTKLGTKVKMSMSRKLAIMWISIKPNPRLWGWLYA